MANVLELQLQYQFFQWIFRVISFRMGWFDLLGTLKSLLQHSVPKHRFFSAQLKLFMNPIIGTVKKLCLLLVCVPWYLLPVPGTWNTGNLAFLVRPFPGSEMDLLGWLRSLFNLFPFFKWNIILLLRMFSDRKLEMALISVTSGVLHCRLVSFLWAEFVLALWLKGFDSE